MSENLNNAVAVMNDDGEVFVDSLVRGRNGSGTSTMVSLQCSESQYKKDKKRVLERILINAGDSTTRYCGENVIKLAKISCILLTSLGIQNTSGLTSILLSLSALGTGKVTIIGPAGLQGLLQHMSPFTNRTYPEVQVMEVASYSDIDSKPLPIVTPLSHFEVHIYPMTLACECQVGAKQREEEEEKEEKEKLEDSPSSSPNSHIFTLSFLLKARMKHALHGGNDDNDRNDPPYSLSNALGVLSTSETLALLPSTKDMVEAFKAAGSNTMISFPMDTDCKPSYLNESSQFAAICKHRKMTCIVNSNIWDSQSVEFKYPQVSLCMLRCLCSSLFPAPLRVFYDGLGEEGNDRHADLDCYSDLCISPGSLVDIGECEHFNITKSGKVIPSKESLTSGSSLMYRKFDELVEDASKFLKVPTSVFLTYLSPVVSKLSSPSGENFSAADRIRNNLKKRKLPSEDVHIANESKRGLLEDSLHMPPPNPFDIKINFLGTGSAAPSKHRNNSAILIHVPTTDSSASAVSILLDAGEGCAAQLYLLCNGNQSRFDKILLQISIVWISHHHADHHCGLPRLIQHIENARKRAINYAIGVNSSEKVLFPKVLVIGSEDVIKYQEYCACVAGLGELCDYIDIKHTSQQPSGSFFPKNTWEKIRQVTRNKVQGASKSFVVSLSSVFVHHCKNSYGLVLHLKRQNPEKIICVVYSGDCRPSNTLQQAGYGCDLLIHEATFDDSMSADACQKKHCTTSEAMLVAKNMAAKHTILTHFSQRYVRGTIQTKIGNDNKDKDNSDGNYHDEDCKFSIAFDFLQVHFPSQIAYLPRITEGVVKCFERVSDGNKIEEGEQGSAGNSL